MICKAIDRVCDWSGALAAFYLAMLAILSLAEILSRNLFSYSIPFATEYAGYLVILILLTGLGWALKDGAHIRVALITDRLSARWQRRFDMAASLLGLVVSGFLAFALWEFGLTTAARGTVSYFPSQTPLALPQLLMTVGPTVLTLAFIARIIRLHHGEAISTGEDAL